LNEVQRCLENPAAFPSMEGSLKPILTDPKLPPATHGNVCYILGRVCELRHQDDAAKAWYRASLESRNDDYACRPLCAIALRRLGEEFFK
jgi:hypothetical protein